MTIKEVCDVEPFNALVFDHLFSERSSNNSGFLVAAFHPIWQTNAKQCLMRCVYFCLYLSDLVYARSSA